MDEGGQLIKKIVVHELLCDKIFLVLRKGYGRKE